MDPDHERVVAQGLRDGRAEAWHALYDEYSEGMWLWVSRRMGGRSADVADVVQEVFLAAARSAVQYDTSRGSLRLWLIGIARNQIALHYRRESRHAPAVHAERWRFAGDGRLERWLDGKHEPVAEELEAAELSGLVRIVLARLSPDYESLLAARYLEGTPVEELAREARTTVTAVRSKLARARQAFRDALANLADPILESISPVGSEKQSLS